MVLPSKVVKIGTHVVIYARKRRFFVSVKSNKNNNNGNNNNDNNNSDGSTFQYHVTKNL